MKKLLVFLILALFLITMPLSVAASENPTIGEKNAVKKAINYIELMPFSQKGLIHQLEFEGFSNKESVYGATHIEVDWNEQAALKAQSYLDLMSFSKKGLIHQLEFEGFTKEQAEYGVEAVGY
ncbi:MAG TPA: Ltp family lipoprotein [Methanoregulaceae archaeon]|nr:Ltp family lipoprotein [Methanoregulaceae archaeon]